MENNGQKKFEGVEIQELLDTYLHLRNPENGWKAADGQHLDEDHLTAFVEGNLVAREVEPVIRHLVNCSFCRHISVELIKLDLAFADDETKVFIQEKSPAKASGILSDMLARIFGTTDSTVFAHQEKEEEQSEEIKDSENIEQ